MANHQVTKIYKKPFPTGNLCLNLRQLGVAAWKINPDRHRSFSELMKIPHNDWIWLAPAQHHGLPTRLPDWSFITLVAAYFATEPAVNHKGIIEPVSTHGSMMYVLHDTNIIDAYTSGQDPFDVHEHRIVFAPVITNRMPARVDCLRSDRTPGKILPKDLRRYLQLPPRLKRLLHRFA